MRRQAHRILIRSPGDANGLNLAGVLSGLSGNPVAAVLWFRRLMAISPLAEDGIANLANAVIHNRRWSEAEPLVRRLIAAAPAHALAHYNRGVAAMNLGHYAETAAASARAHALNGALGDAPYNEAQARLAIGDWRRGFELYERRWNAPSFPMRWSRLPGRHWDGGPAGDAHLLLVAEQGHGDTIQFVRYAPLCLDLVGRVTVACPRNLQSLAATIPGISVVEDGTSLPDVDLHAPIASLPYLFRTTPGTVPANIPYFRLDASQVHRSAELLPQSRQPKVGLCWKGNPGFSDDARRSPKLEALRPILSVPGIVFVSLAKVLGDDRLEGFAIADPMDAMRDFADTAHLIANLDLVISSDTAVTHLAGAIGRPTWTLLSAAADWRWLMDRTDTPWYPTMTLFRQSTLGDWDGPVSRAAGMLKAWVSERSGDG